MKLMTNTTYYKLTPISEKPEKDGWYYIANPNEEILPRMIEYRRNEGWLNWMELNAAYYLRPVTSDELVKENERLRELLLEAFISGANADNQFCGFPSEAHKYRMEIFEEFKKQHNL
jgi:hypothetical protein